MRTYCEISRINGCFKIPNHKKIEEGIRLIDKGWRDFGFAE